MGRNNNIITDFDLYFVAIIPPEPLVSKIREMKLVACHNFQSCAAMKSPPHITLHMPFRWKKKKEEKLFTFFKEFQADVSAFKVEVNGVDHFGDRVIYLSIAANSMMMHLQSTLVKSMKRELNLFNAQYKGKAFHPHITLAFRDLKKHHFEPAISHFKSMGLLESFQSDCYTLLKHDGNQWHSFREYVY